MFSPEAPVSHLSRSQMTHTKKSIFIIAQGFIHSLTFICFHHFISVYFSKQYSYLVYYDIP